MAGPRLAKSGTNGAGSPTTSRPCGPTFAQINREGWLRVAENRAGRVAGSTPRPHICAEINRTNSGDRSRPHNPGLRRGEIKPQTSDWKRPWGLGRQQEKLPASQERSWKDPQGPRVCTRPPTLEPAPEGPSLIVGRGVKDWNPVESGAGTIAPSRPLPHVQRHSTATSVTPPREHLRLRPFK